MTKSASPPSSGEGVPAALLRWQRYLEVTARGNANTRRQYRRLLLAVFADVIADPEWTGPRDPLQLTEDDLVTFLSERTSEHGATRGMTIRALRSFFGWAADRELVARNPALHLRASRPKYGPAPALAPAQLEAILVAAESVDPRARWAIQLQYATGCRIGSLVPLTPDDVRWLPSGPSLVFREAKFGRSYEVPLGPRGEEAVRHLIELKDYLAPKTTHRRPTLLGVGENRYRQWLEAAAERAGVKAWTHLLRHTTATEYAAAGVDTRTIMELLDWQTPAMLRRYAARSDENMRRAAL